MTSEAAPAEVDQCCGAVIVPAERRRRRQCCSKVRVGMFVVAQQRVQLADVSRNGALARRAVEGDLGCGGFDEGQQKRGIGRVLHFDRDDRVTDHCRHPPEVRRHMSKPLGDAFGEDRPRLVVAAGEDPDDEYLRGEHGEHGRLADLIASSNISIAVRSASSNRAAIVAWNVSMMATIHCMRGSATSSAIDRSWVRLLAAASTRRFRWPG
jgi:hypothetical protein